MHLFNFEGTGKTVTGVHIAFGFAKRNKQNLHTFDPGSLDEVKAPPQVIYCGPSNKAVDVVAGKFKICYNRKWRLIGNWSENTIKYILNESKQTFCGVVQINLKY